MPINFLEVLPKGLRLIPHHSHVTNEESKVTQLVHTWDSNSKGSDMSACSLFFFLHFNFFYFLYDKIDTQPFLVYSSRNFNIYIDSYNHHQNNSLMSQFLKRLCKIGICFMYCEALLLRAYAFRIVILSW